MKVILIAFFTYGCASNSNDIASQPTLRVKQTLVDNQSGVDGLGGARVVELTPDGRQLLVASADDNSLAVFNVDENFHLTFGQKFVNNSNVDGLEGATSVVVSPDGQRAYIASFYDSAIAIFERNELEEYEFLRAIRDGLPYDEVFSAKESVRSKDILGLLGAYDIAITSDNRQLFVASVASSAVSVFDIDDSGDVTFKQSIRDSDNVKYGLGGAVNVVVTPDDSQVIVAGFNDNAITVFDRNSNGLLDHNQTLENGDHHVMNMQTPQGLAISPDGRHLYVACSGSNAIIVFAKNEQGKYAFIQSLSNNDEHIKGLGGASYVTTSPNGKRIFVSAEKDKTVVTLAKVGNGKLKVLSVTDSQGENKAEAMNGAASVYVSPDGLHLLVTTGKGDTLIVYDLQKLDE